MFIDIDDSFSGKVLNANKTESEICGRGTVAFLVKDSNQVNRKIILENALFIPENSHSLVSISKLREAGAEVLIGPELSIIDKSGLEYPFRQEKSLFIWDFSEIDKTCKENCLVSSSLKMWHKRLGHNYFTDLSKLVEHVEGMRISDSSVDVCEICELNQAKKQPIAKDCTTRAQAVLDIVHTDSLGPITPEAVDGHKYAIEFVDSFSRYCRVYFKKSRDETLEKFQQFCADVGQPLTLVSDGAKEYISSDFKKFARLKGIRLGNSAAYTLQENGQIEKLWDVTVGTARCLGDQASLEKKYWTYSLNMAFHLKKFCYLSAIKKTPHEAMYGEKPNLSFMKVFGCVAYPFIEKQFRNKIDRKAKKRIFLGQALDSRSFLIGIENDRGELKVQKSRNARFNENNYCFGVNGQASLEHEVNKEMSEIVFLSEIVDQNLLPKNAKEALENENWRKAMQDEYNSLSENKVWDLVEDNEAKVVGSRWHFGVKYGPTGEISRFKAMFVAKGYSQVIGKDFHETYSPTTRLSTIRLIVSLSVQKGSKIRQMDIKTAYLNAPIAEEIYMKQP